jgi:thymidylate kinase
MNTERTQFITFDGLDATGKTTLAEMLRAKLNALVLRTPPDWIRPLRETFNKQRVEMGAKAKSTI